MSRHNITQAQQVFQGKAQQGNYQQGKLGIEFTPLYRYKPLGTRVFTLAAGLTAGSASCTLQANWSGLTGFYPITFSDLEQLYGFFTNGSETVTFYQGSFPLDGNLGLDSLQNAVSATLMVGNLPPVLAVSTAYCASQSVAASAAFLINAATYVATVNGVTVGAPDVPRNVTATWTGTAVITVAGLDFWGYPQTEVSASGTSFTGAKAFSQITSITSSASITSATAGFGAKLGLPFRILQGDVLAMMFNDAADAGTIVDADQTTPATSSTGDVRGTYTAAGTLNGYKNVAILMKVGDTSTQYGAFGVTPA